MGGYDFGGGHEFFSHPVGGHDFFFYQTGGVMIFFLKLGPETRIFRNFLAFRAILIENALISHIFLRISFQLLGYIM